MARAHPREKAAAQRRWSAAAVAFAVGSFGALHDAAAQSDAQQKAAAEALFEEGKQLLGQGQYESACHRFEQSEEIDRGVGTLLYLADCYEKSGRLASAWAIFREASSAAAAQGQGERARMADERARRLAPSLSKLVLLVPQEDRIAGVEILLDGKPLSAALYGVPFPIDSGARELSARAPGRAPWSYIVEIKPNDYRSLQVPVLASDTAPVALAPVPPAQVPLAAAGSATAAGSTVVGSTMAGSTMAGSTMAGNAAAGSAAGIQAAPVPAATLEPPGGAPSAELTREPPPGLNASAAEAPQRSRGRIDHSLSYIVGGAGVVGLGLGIGFGVRAADKDSASRPDCPSGCVTRAAAEQNQSARTSAAIANVSYALGAAALVTGVVLYFTTGSNAAGSNAVGSNSAGPHAAGAKSASASTINSLALEPSVGADSAALSLSGRF